MIPTEVPDYAIENFPQEKGFQHVTWKSGDSKHGDLPAVVHPRANTSRSFWMPTDEELDQLRNGHCVMLTIIGSQPPVSLGVI